MEEQAFQASQSMTVVVSVWFCLGKESRGRTEWRRGYECGFMEAEPRRSSGGRRKMGAGTAGWGPGEPVGIKTPGYGDGSGRDT